MKCAIVFLGIVAAGSAASILSVNGHASPELRHSYGKSVLESRDLDILTPRGVDKSDRRASPKGSQSGRPVSKASPDTSAETNVKQRTQAAFSGKGPEAGSQAHTPQQHTVPSETRPGSPLGPSYPGSQQLMQAYLHQDQRGQQSPGPYQPQSRNRAPHLLDIVHNHSDRNSQQGWSPWQGGNPQHFGWGGMPSQTEHYRQENSWQQQLYANSRSSHLLNVVRNEANKNMQQDQLEQYEKSRQHIGWGGQPIPPPIESNYKPLDKSLGRGGFPNMVIHGSKTGETPRTRTGRSPNPRMERRNVSQGQASLSQVTLKRRGEVNSHRISSFSSLSSISSLSSLSSSSSSPERQHQANNSVTHVRQPQVGGPSGRTVYRRPTLSERLRWTGGPSRVVPRNRQHASPRHVGPEVRVPHSPGSVTTIDSADSRGTPVGPATPHPALAFLPASIEGSASPSLSRSTPRRRLFSSTGSLARWLEGANNF